MWRMLSKTVSMAGLCSESEVGEIDPSEFHSPGSRQGRQLRRGLRRVRAGAAAAEADGTASELVLALSRADAALGELSGVGGELPDPQLLDAPFKRQEALCSSRIEGAEVSLSDLLLDQVGAARRRACRATTCVRCAAASPPCASASSACARSRCRWRSSSDLHERLCGARSACGRTPGEFRTSQNWVGPPGATLATATYVPPPVSELDGALAAWEAFLQQRGTLPDLVQCAMLHEQFQAIHPFVGGNGRLGRLLITLFLMERAAHEPPAAVSVGLLRGAPRRVLPAAAARAHARGVGAVAAVLREWRARDGRAVDAPGARAHRAARAQPHLGQRAGPQARRRALPYAVPDGAGGAEGARRHQPHGTSRAARARGGRHAAGVGREALAARVPGATDPRRRAAPGRGPAERPGRHAHRGGAQVRRRRAQGAAPARRPPHG